MRHKYKSCRLNEKENETTRKQPHCPHKEGKNVKINQA